MNISFWDILPTFMVYKNDSLVNADDKYKVIKQV
jgi:hypothetical protein